MCSIANSSLQRRAEALGWTRTRRHCCQRHRMVVLPRIPQCDVSFLPATAHHTGHCPCPAPANWPTFYAKICTATPQKIANSVGNRKADESGTETDISVSNSSLQVEHVNTGPVIIRPRRSSQLPGLPGRWRETDCFALCSVKWCYSLLLQLSMSTKTPLRQCKVHFNALQPFTYTLQMMITTRDTSRDFRAGQSCLLPIGINTSRTWGRPTLTREREREPNPSEALRIYVSYHLGPGS